MSKALSADLRERVVAAVAAGASCRAAAAVRSMLRTGVSASSAIRWCTLAREAGSVAPGPLGGDRRSARIEAHADLILDLVDRKSDITVAEIQAELAKSGVQVGIGTIWRFWDALLDSGTPRRCGWLRDHWGLCWQITPKRLGELMRDPDREKARRVTEAMLGMVKFDIATPEAAARAGTA
jgi:transposase